MKGKRSIAKHVSRSSITVLSGKRSRKVFKTKKIKATSGSPLRQFHAALRQDASPLTSASPQSNERVTSSTSYNEESAYDFFDDYVDCDDYEPNTDEPHAASSNNNSFLRNNHYSIPSSQQYHVPRSKNSSNDDWAKLFPDLWKAYLRGLGLYTVDLTKLELIRTRKCSCDTMDTNKVICIFECGIKRDISVLSCNICENFSLPIVLMESHMFPCSPKLPEVAIHIAVMDNYFLQQYIQRQAITNIAKLVQNESPRTVPKSFKTQLNRVLPIYSKMKLVIEHHLEQSYDLISSDICPACMFETHDENSSPLLVALDGNFSLRRLKSVPDDSGHYLLNPEYHNLKNYWVAKPIIAKTRTNSRSTQSCASFKALSGQQKKMKGGLDETGVFGSTCARHGFPLFFISMTTGETFDYPISILNRIKQRYGTNIGVLYDVACKLKPSLEQTLPELKDIPMAVSVWHAYNHVPQCQIDFHPRLLPNYGMTDGEWLERLWSYTNPFVPQTKYSGPNHRKLTLTCAFNTFKKEKITNIGKTLKAKYARAAVIKEEASKKLENYNMERLGELWKEFKEEKRSQPIPQLGTYNQAKENLRQAVAKYDWTLEILHVQKIGIRRAEQYSRQLKVARARVEKELKAYNDIRGEDTEHMSVADILAENSTFRMECNVFHHEIYPFEQYHNYQRADEELKILKNEAKSVLNFGAKAVHLLKSALNLLNEKQTKTSQEEGEALLLSKKLNDTEEWWYTQFQMLNNFLTDSEPQISTEEDNDNIEDGIADIIGDGNIINNIEIDSDDDFTDLTATQAE